MQPPTPAEIEMLKQRSEALDALRDKFDDFRAKLIELLPVSDHADTDAELLAQAAAILTGEGIKVCSYADEHQPGRHWVSMSRGDLCLATLRPHEALHLGVHLIATASALQ